MNIDRDIALLSLSVSFIAGAVEAPPHAAI
jgi:hypothetical protein